MIVCEFTMLDPLGFHTSLVDETARFLTTWSETKDHRFTFSSGGKTADAAQPEEMKMLDVRPGDVVRISVRGAEEAQELALTWAMWFLALNTQIRVHMQSDMSDEPDDSETLLRIAESNVNVLSILDRLTDSDLLNDPKKSAIKRVVMEYAQEKGLANEVGALMVDDESTKLYKTMIAALVTSLCDSVWELPEYMKAIVEYELHCRCDLVVGYSVRFFKGTDPWVVVHLKGEPMQELRTLPMSREFLEKVNNPFPRTEQSSTAAQSPARSQSAVTEQPKQQEEESGSLAGGFVILGLALLVTAIGALVVLQWFPGAQTVATLVLGLLITAGFAGLFAELDHVVPGIVAGLVVQAFLLHYIWSMGHKVILPTLLVGIALVVVPALLTSEK